MAKSKERKRRDKLKRNGLFDPSLMRLDWGVRDGVTRKTPTKKEKMYKIERKYKRGDIYE
jgi:hypothetical protein